MDPSLAEQLPWNISDQQLRYPFHEGTNDLKSIIGELTIENETLKNPSRKERLEDMMDLIAKGCSKSGSALLTGVTRSMIYYRHRERKPKYDADPDKRIFSIVEERPVYSARRVTAVNRRSSIMTERNRIGCHIHQMNPISKGNKIHRKDVPGITDVTRPSIMWETVLTRVYINCQGWVYLTAYLDLCSRNIKGCLVSRMPVQPRISRPLTMQ